MSNTYHDSDALNPRLRVFGMIVDSLILAGGRSSRLGHSDKQNLQIGGESLLQRSVSALREVGARDILIVGDEGVDDIPAVREEPAFTGPVAAIAAGLNALPGGADAVLVIACDMPGVAAALPVLLAAFEGDGAIAVDRDRRQHLVIAVEPHALRSALHTLPSVGDASMRALLGTLDLIEVMVPEGSTDDIDTWDDAARFGATRPTDRSTP
jgi:molybdopterin-guanine dinucleotide biosynthesis protein A